MAQGLGARGFGVMALGLGFRGYGIWSCDLGVWGYYRRNSYQDHVEICLRDPAQKL